MYGYVEDPNILVDILGLTGTYMFTDGKNWYIGKGSEARMNTSMKQRIGGKDKATQSLHIDYGDNKTGFMVEAELMRRKDAVKNDDFANAINSPDKKLLEDAKINNKTLYEEIMQKADDFEKQFNQQNKNNKQKTKSKAMSLDKTIRENLDGNYLTIHVEDFQEGIKYAAQIKIRQIHLIGSQAKDIIVDFKELDKLSETLQVISFIQDIGNVVNFESIYNLKEMRKVYFQDKQKFTFDISRFTKLQHLGGDYWEWIN